MLIVALEKRKNNNIYQLMSILNNFTTRFSPFESLLHFFDRGRWIFCLSKLENNKIVITTDTIKYNIVLCGI